LIKRKLELRHLDPDVHHGTSKYWSKEAEEEVVRSGLFVLWVGTQNANVYGLSGPRERVCTPRTSTSDDAADAADIVVAYIANTAAVKDKAQHAVILDKATSDRLYKDVQSYRLITVATLVDRLKINGSLARRCLADLEEKGQIKKVVGHSKLSIYSMLIPSRLVYSVYSQSTQGLPLTTQQLVRSLPRNKGPFTASLRDHDRSPFGIEGTVEWAGVGLLHWVWDFRCSISNRTASQLHSATQSNYSDRRDN
jgi:small subunit ribosomal protein S25e